MLLIADLEEAATTLFDGEPPRNVRRCFCIDKRDKRRGIHLAFNRTGEPTQSPVSAYNGHPRMKTDTETQIRFDNLAFFLSLLFIERLTVATGCSRRLLITSSNNSRS